MLVKSYELQPIIPTAQVGASASTAPTAAQVGASPTMEGVEEARDAQREDELDSKRQRTIAEELDTSKTPEGAVKVQLPDTAVYGHRPGEVLDPHMAVMGHQKEMENLHRREVVQKCLWQKLEVQF
eukprot:4418050-Amphidinium_carterae.6